MGEEKGRLESMREWLVEHKLRAVGKYVFIFPLLYDVMLQD